LVDEGEISMNLEDLGKDLCFYADKVIPPNWNIYTDSSEHRCSHRALNIHILLMDTTPSDWVKRQRETGLVMPAALTRAQRYNTISEASRCKTEIKDECRSKGDGVFADTEIWMFPFVLQGENQDLFAALVHELAHVAVSRLLARKYRAFKSGHIHIVNSAVMLEEGMHGPTYQRALRRFALRVEAAWGQEAAEKIWQELESI
jgi:hypothetical protein